LAWLVQQLPGGLSAGVVAQMLKGVDVIVSDVPGIQERRWLVGSEVRRLFGFAPTPGAACNVTLLSFRDRACIGLLSDTAAVEDPAGLTRAIEEGLREVIALGRSAQVSAPPPQPADGQRGSRARAGGPE